MKHFLQAYRAFSQTRDNYDYGQAASYDDVLRAANETLNAYKRGCVAENLDELGHAEQDEVLESAEALFKFFDYRRGMSKQAREVEEYANTYLNVSLW